MDNRWLGPYQIIKDLGKGFFSLHNLDTGKIIQRVHGAHLKIYNTPLNTPTNSVKSQQVNDVLLYFFVFDFQYYFYYYFIHAVFE